MLTICRWRALKHASHDSVALNLRLKFRKKPIHENVFILLNAKLRNTRVFDRPDRWVMEQPTSTAEQSIASATKRAKLIKCSEMWVDGAYAC